MIIKVVGAGINHFTDLYKYDENEYLIGVDGGAETIIQNNLSLKLAIGDFDSSSKDYIKKHCDNIITFPAHKDKSDLELTMIYLESVDWDIEDIIIYNATGNRLDHFYAGIHLLVNYSHLPIKIVDKMNMISLIKDETVFTKNEYKYISFFATEDNTIISLKGFQYDLDKYPLAVYDNLCLSNEIKKNRGTVSINNKKVIVFQSN